jgi:aldose sugar dehydrogenase
MAFLAPDDILVLEKNNGTVHRIVNGNMLPKPLLDVNVATLSERGLLGIAIAKNLTTTTPSSGHTYVYLYYTETATKDGEDVSETVNPWGNRLYRYEFVNDKLTDPQLISDLPAVPGPFHNVGKIAIGPNGIDVYIVIGESLNSYGKNSGYFLLSIPQIQ